MKQLMLMPMLNRTTSAQTEPLYIRNFKMYTGTTPKQFILQKRINNAETLLQNKQYNIKEIAQIIGYDNPLYFSRIFQRTKGISPSEYRKNI